jgi:hypothetical protein
MSYIQELENIRKKHNNILKPEDVVEFAANPKTALHKKFTWDDREAARQYRLWQAREIIRISVNVLPQNNKPFKAYVSIKEDRKNPGGGYRSMIEVMNDTELRKKLLGQAFADMKNFQSKYQEIEELIPVFEAMDKTIDKIEPLFKKAINQ